jgi:hypothetical protein
MYIYKVVKYHKWQNKFCFDKMRWVIVLIYSLIIFVAADQHLNAHGPFGKRHTINSEPSPYACNRPNGVASPTTVTVATLNVSATTYSSNEQIIVTWTPLSPSCEDDFIGIYFAEIPLETGKYNPVLGNLLFLLF